MNNSDRSFSPRTAGQRRQAARIGRRSLKRIALLVTLALTTTGWAGTVATNETEMVVRVDLSSVSARDFEGLMRTHLDILARGKNWADILAVESEVDSMREAGFGIEVRIPDARAYERVLRGQDYFDYFRDYQEIVDELQQIALDYPSIVSLHDIGDGWEKTQGIADRDIWAVKISDNVEIFECDEPEALIISNIHPREILTPEINMHLIHHLTANYGTDSLVTSLINERQIWIVPTMNPDGLDYAHHVDLWWRWNRRDNGDGTFGVDLNRNFGYMWGYDNIYSSPIPGAETYRGTAPFSEPETQAIRDFTEAHHFILALSYHQYGNVWIFPWEYVPDNTPDHDTFVAIAESCVAYNGYELDRARVNGGTNDWFYGEQTTKYKVFGFVPEVGSGEDGFHPDTNRIEPLILENLGANLYIIDAAEEYSPRPVIAHEPLPDTEDVVGPYRVVAAITGPLWPIDETSAEVHYSWNGAEFESASLSPTGLPDEYEGWIPGPGLMQSGIYGYYLTASDSAARAGCAPPGAPDSLFSFVVGLDSTPPAIVHEPLGDQSILAAPFPILVEATDNVGIATVWTEYRVNQGSLVTVPMVPQGGDVYLGAIDPEVLELGDMIEYRVVARDATVAGNETSHPEEGFHAFLILEGYSYDFEAGGGGFAGSPGGDWEWGIPSSGPGTAHSGQNVWATDLSGTYADNSNSTLDTPPLSLVNVIDPSLTFWQWYQMEYSDETFWDGGNVKISADGGVTFELLYPQGGYDGTASSAAGNPLGGEPVYGGPADSGNYWHQELFDLSDYVNRTVIVRFHFGSDGVGTPQNHGWYIDDVFLSTQQSEVPLFTRTTQLPATDDTLGPYVVTSEVTDDEGVSAVALHYQSQNAGFTQVPMQLAGDLLFTGEIPGQSYETTVEYYLSAVDTDGNISTDPPGAPDSLFSFLVTESVPQLGPVPATIVLSTDPGGMAAKTLVISNLGLIDLEFSLADTAVGEEMQGVTEVIVDSIGDAPSGSPDIRALRAERTESTILLEVVFASSWPELSFVVVSLDLDQDPSTGAMPPGLGTGYPYHDVGSEIEVVFDMADFYEVGQPSAIVRTADGSATLGTVPLLIGPEGPSAVFPLSLLGDDGNMNVCMLSVTDIVGLSDVDFAPDIGHGVIGEYGDALWLSEAPTSGMVPGQGSAVVQLVADAAYLPQGRHEARLHVATNDPLNPAVVIDVTFYVGDVAAPDPTPLPIRLALSARPNPFTDAAMLNLGLPTSGHVTVRMYNPLGQSLCTLVDGEMQAGWHSLRWPGRTSQGRVVAPGLYLCRIETPAGATTLRLLKTR